jgi:hypothetical protein
MVPHSLFVSSDRHVDLALNLLTMVVGGALLATVAYLMFAWIRPGVPATDRTVVGPPAWAAMPTLLLPPPLEFEFELQLPGLPAIYRCEQRGRITYTDRPCAAGYGRALAERPS